MSIKKWRLLNRRELQQLAHKKGITGSGRLSREDLISALERQAKANPRRKLRPVTNGAVLHAKPTAAESPPKSPKDLAAKVGKDRIVCMVRDPYWLHAFWELTRQSIERAEAALGQNWHGARPILRLISVTPCEVHQTVEKAIRDIEIHGGCNNWYIEAPNPPCSYRVDIGYLAKNGQFFTLGRSNIVTTPRPGMTDTLDDNWADFDFEQASKILAMSGGFDPSVCSLELKQLFEERLRRPIGTPTENALGPSACMFGKERRFDFQLHAELILQGVTEPGATVILGSEPIKLRKDGTFTIRVILPEGRHIFTAEAVSADGVDERKIVLAVERNTRLLEPVTNELDE